MMTRFLARVFHAPFEPSTNCRCRAGSPLRAAFNAPLRHMAALPQPRERAHELSELNPDRTRMACRRSVETIEAREMAKQVRGHSSLVATVLVLAMPIPYAVAGVFIVGTQVPDGSGVGLPDVRTVSGAPLGVAPTVGLTLSGVGAGMINGDIYATLSHENAGGSVDAFVVLLNRPGKRAGNDDGYFDSGIDVSFSPDPTVTDVHNYRLTLNGSHGIPLGGPLTGSWGPDGRATDPETVLDTDERTTSLAPFASIDPNEGRWVLFLADLASGGQARLESWSLTFDAAPIPEPAEAALLLGLALAGWGMVRRRR